MRLVAALLDASHPTHQHNKDTTHLNTMSSLYNLEPQPTASCILHTTHGPISLELFAQQTPLTSRNFLQLALDGYYDGTIFHRLIPGFILQGGDPTGTGHGGESIYDSGALSAPRPPEGNGIWPMEERTGANAGPHGVGFKDEFHSRLKYNRRGLLGMANEGPNTNLSQFFLTLGATPELQGKNTLFGRVAGDTIYNLARMGEVEVESERPVYPMKVERVEILINPFTDMVARPRTVAQAPKQESKKQPAKRKKPAKQLLSFGDDEGDVAPVMKKKKFDERIVMEDPDAPAPAPAPKTDKPKTKSAAPLRRTSHTPPPRKASPPRRTLPQKRSEGSLSTSPEPEPVAKVSSLLDETNAQIAALKASMKRTIDIAPEKAKPKNALEAMIPSRSIRGRKRKAGAGGKEDMDSLKLLKSFQRKLEEAPPEEEPEIPEPAENGEKEADGEGEGDEEAALCDLHFIANCESCKRWDHMEHEADAEEDDGKGWMSHVLSFERDKKGKDLRNRQKGEDELVVIDPREKAKTLKEERKSRRDREQGKAETRRGWDKVGGIGRKDI